ncbi:hypothetical protein [uncultured Dokdonia sp.]|uniref:hypothetical protein n=1 Tax=uncultured Dokdonia sp. TaxID=575653 RepID=UPI002628B0A9|nr:hypothetical protein [uncultured Dokdonia sp.]
MKTLITMIVTLCITATTFAQTVTEKETIINISPKERKQIQEVKELILDLSENLSTSLQEKEALSKNDIDTLKKLLEAIDEKYEGQKLHKEIVIKTDDPSKNMSISYAFSIDSDDEKETIEGIKDLDLSELKEKLNKLSISISESDAIQLLVKKLKEKEMIMVKETEEKEEKTKH